MSKIVTGPAKSMDNITLEDVLQHPIWVWALDGESVETQDETWQKPIINATDLSRDVIGEYLVATITCKVVGTELFASGEYDHQTARLKGIAVWSETEWRAVHDVFPDDVNLEFEAIPTIVGLSGVRFSSYEPDMEEARRTDMPSQAGGIMVTLRRLLGR